MKVTSPRTRVFADGLKLKIPNPGSSGRALNPTTSLLTGDGGQETGHRQRDRQGRVKGQTGRSEAAARSRESGKRQGRSPQGAAPGIPADTGASTPGLRSCAGRVPTVLRLQLCNNSLRQPKASGAPVTEHVLVVHRGREAWGGAG